MLSLLLLVGLCVGYYYLHMYYPREQKEHIYMGIFVSVSLVLIYLFHFEEGFVHKVFRQIYSIQKKPLYDLSDFTTKGDDMKEFKDMVLRSQGSRCARCQNFILPRDITYTSLDYRVPLDQGGSNTHDNIMIVCPTCNTKFY